MTAPAEHPDRAATTLADRARLIADNSPQPESAGAGIGDARVDLHLLWHAVDRTLATRSTAAALDWLAGLDTADLRAGTVQDGTARGLRARLEEAISLCKPASPSPDPDPDEDVITGKDLRRKREILIASAGVRIRFSRKQGVHLIDRARDVNTPHFLQFDDQRDIGCLDRFVPKPDTRARIFSPAFLEPEQLVQSSREDRLVLGGRLGRGRDGFDCRLTLIGRKDERGIRLRIAIDNRVLDHRLRIRFVGETDAAFVSHRGTPEFSTIRAGSRRFLAATLVRACGRLRVGDAHIPTPDAQMQGPIEHEFGLGLDI
jgi:hypothetical protein